MKRVLIDANSVVPFYVDGTVKGIGRTTRELVKALDSIEDLPFEIVLYSQNMKGVGGRNLETRFQTKHLYMPYREGWNKWVSRLNIRELLCRYDLMHIPHNYAETRHADRCIVTLHDALFFSFPEEAFRPEFCRKHYTEFAQKCRAVITCSEASKVDIVNYMRIPEERIHVIPWGYNSNLFRPGEKSPKPYFISASCSTGRKNTLRLVQAYRIYRQRGGTMRLALVWNNPPAEAHSEGIEIMQNVDDVLLARLYAGATACFFPSSYEGFGLPVLESMASGTPVVTCRNSSLPEVGGDAAIYTEPEAEAMAEEMMRFEQLPADDYHRLTQASLAQASKFSWERCAQQTIHVYQQLL